MYFMFYQMANNVLDSVEIQEDGREEEPADDIRDVDVEMRIVGSGLNQSYRTQLTSNETIGDFLESLRDEGKISYEQVEYTYGTEITRVNGVLPPEGYSWNVYDGTELVTYFTRYKLSDDAVYTLRLEPAR